MPTRSVARSKKPAKPRRTFPLHAHANGQWAKKVRGKRWYFGPWSDPEGAEKLWDAQKEDILAGRDPRRRDAVEGLLGVEEACEAFLESKEAAVEQRELSRRHFNDLHRACKSLVKELGSTTPIDSLKPRDFSRLKLSMVRKWNSPHSVKREIQIIRSIVRWWMEADLTEQHIKFGPDFKVPKKETIRRHDYEKKRDKGSKDFSPAECRELLDHAPTPAMRCFILLGLNCGAGNTDVRTLHQADLDLDAGWWETLRNKTATLRKGKLWDITVDALREYLAVRPEPHDDAHRGLVFITRHGLPYGDGSAGNEPIGREFQKLLRKLDLHNGNGAFYRLRHTFATLAAPLRDEEAAALVMGHVHESIRSGYRHDFDEGRLEDLANYVHARIFGERRAPK